MVTGLFKLLCTKAIARAVSAQPVRWEGEAVCRRLDSNNKRLEWARIRQEEFIQPLLETSMSLSTFRKALLTGTALVAVSFCVTTVAHAADGATPTTSTTISTTTSGGAGTAGTTGNPGSNGGAGDDGVQAGANNITITNASTINGGAGGIGGSGAAATNAGGNGGLGGHGVNLPSAQDGTNATTKITITNTTGHAINGGAGGAGGNGGGGNSTGGNGNTGGTGIYADSNYTTINNAGTINGGNGGNGGNSTGTNANSNGGNAGNGISVIATNVTITNSGTITAGAAGNDGTGGSGAAGVDGSSGAAIEVRSGATNATINNSGTINGGTGVGVAVNETLGAAGFVNSGTILSTGGGGVFIDTGKSTTVFNNTGTINAGNSSAINLQGTFGTLTNLGTLTSSGVGSPSLATMIIGSDQTVANDLVLNGSITNTNAGSAATALYISSSQTTAGDHAIINTGSIIADGAAAGSGGAVAVNFAAGAGGTFTNSGTLRGDIVATTGDQQIKTLGGSIIGDINLGAGNNALFVGLGSVTGHYTGGINDDYIRVEEGTFTGDITFSDGTNALDLEDGGKLTAGLISAGTGNDSIHVYGGTHTANGIDLGAGANTLTFDAGSLTSATGLVTGGGVDTINFNGGAFNSAINLGAGNNVINVNQNVTTSGAIGATGGNVAVNIAAGKTLTANHVITQLGALAVGTGSVFNLNQSNTSNAATGALTNAGRINIAANKTLSVNTYTPGTGTINFIVGTSGGALTPGVLNVTGGAADLTGSQIVFNVDPTAGALPAGAVTFVNSTGGATLPAGANITDTSLLYNFTTVDAGNNLTVAAARVAGGAVGLSNSENNAAVAAVFDANTGSTNPGIVAAQGRLAAATTSAQFNDVLESAAPTVDTSASDAAATVATQTQNLTVARLAALRNAKNTGVASGDGMSEGRVWLQPFASTVDQDKRDGIDGYTADTYGVALGADTDALFNNTVVGVAVTYGNTNADSDNANSTESDVDSYQIQVYADHDLGNRAFVEGSLGYGRNNIDRTRHNVGGVPGTNADADFSSNQYIAAASIGQTFAPSSSHPALELTPRAGVRYTHLDTDSFTETGAGGLNLAVDTQDKDALEFSVGTEVAYNIATQNGTLTPAAHVGYTYDAIGDDIQTSSTFTGGGAAFNTDGADPAQSTFNVGAGLTYYSNANFDLSVNYDAQIKEDYVGHAGYLKAVRKF